MPARSARSATDCRECRILFPGPAAGFPAPGPPEEALVRLECWNGRQARRRSLPGTAALLAGAALLAACAGCGSDRTDRPNIVLITVESLRADHVGCYGYGLPTTPSLDALAGESVRFENAFSVTSWTLASHAAILTGLTPSALRVLEPHDRLADSYETIAEALSEDGYYCAAFLSGPFLRAPYNMNQGFSHYDDSPSAVSTGNAHGDVTNPEMEE
ncbi:MAG: hypothetical protein EHM19_12820, partial [Candidatus Latescibacterota bacterium]